MLAASVLVTLEHHSYGLCITRDIGRDPVDVAKLIHLVDSSHPREWLAKQDDFA